MLHFKRLTRITKRNFHLGQKQTIKILKKSTNRNTTKVLKYMN